MFGKASLFRPVLLLGVLLGAQLACDEPNHGPASGTDVGRLDGAAPGAGSTPGSGGSPGTGGLPGSNPRGGAGGAGGAVPPPPARLDGGAVPPTLDAGPPSLPPVIPPPVQPPALPPGGTPRPARLVVLGDSITACSNLGSKQDPGCSPFKLFQYLKTTYAPTLEYENEAIGGAVTEDVPERELDAVMTGPGHVLALIFVGGNDLRRYLLSDDATAEMGFRTSLLEVKAAWARTFAFFADRAKFPDGVTVLMNNQYNPWDGCTAFPYFLSARKNQLLGAYNMELAAIAAANGAQLVDQHTPFLGHGHHYNVRSCPHYMAGATPFMGDLIHPNRAGHEHLFQQWKKVVDRLYTN